MSINLSRRCFNIAMASFAAASAPTISHGEARIDIARIIVGYAPGGSADVISRKLAQRLSGSYARSVLVENRPGAAGRLGVQAIKSLPADGSAMLITPASVLTLYPHLYKQLGYDVFADLTPVAIVASFSFALVVGPAVPVSVVTLDDFVKWCKANPVLAQCANAGAGSLPHFLGILFAREAAINITHVPYSGGLVAMQATAAGHVAAAVSTEASAVALAQAGKLRVLATTGKSRSVILPQAPTFDELGMTRVTQNEWFGAFMPAKAPVALVATAADSLVAALREPDIRETWNKLGLGAEGSTSAELQRALRNEYDFWGPIIKASGFTPES